MIFNQIIINFLTLLKLWIKNYLNKKFKFVLNLLQKIKTIHISLVTVIGLKKQLINIQT